MFQNSSFTRGWRRSALAGAVTLAFIAVGLTSPAYAASSSDQQDVFDATNDYRESRDRSALRFNCDLHDVAQAWAEKMASNNKLQHNPKVSSQIPSGWSAWGENVAWNSGYSDPTARLVTQWINSDGHRANMVNSDYTDMGVGVYRAPNGKTWGVQVFARYNGAGSPVPASGFCDVPNSHPFADEVSWMVSEGVTSGYSDGKFHPGATVSRQAMAAFLYRLAGEPAFSPPGSATYSDVPTSHPFYKEVEWFTAEGVAGGYPDGTFRPTHNVTRHAVAAFLYRFAGEPTVEVSDNPSFADTPPSYPFYVEIEWMTSLGIAGGYDDGTFRGSSKVSRQAISAFLYRYNLEVN